MVNNTTEFDESYGLDYILLFRLIVWGYIGLMLSLFGIVGNIITIFVLISPSMRTISTNIYLTAISCSNILFLLIFIPSYSVRYLLGYSVYMSNQPPFAFEILLARLPTTAVYNTIRLSIIYLTIAVSMDRLILIKFPLKAKTILTQRSTLIRILLIYIFSITYCIPYWFEQQYFPRLKRCDLTEIGKKTYKYTRIYIYIPIVYVIPFVTLTCINITIIQNLFAMKRHKQNLFGKTNKKTSADYHITLMLVFLIIVFVLCEIPLLVLNAWYAIYPDESYNNLKFQTMNSVGVLLIVFNTSMNFLLYCFFGQKFRQTLVEFLLNLVQKNSTLQRRNLKQSQLSLQPPQQRATSRTSSTTDDSKLVRVKHDAHVALELSPSSSRTPVRINTEESRPLISSPIVHLETPRD